MILSYTHKFIFFCNGKTGSTSVESALSPYQEGEAYDLSSHGLFGKKHVPPGFVKAYMPAETWNTCFKFVFVRNPWDWVVSNWKYNFEVQPQQRREARSLAERLRDYGRGRREIYRVDYRDVLSVEDIEKLYLYLKAVKVTPAEVSACQYPYVYDADGHQLVDFVGRFESLEEDFGTVSRQLSLNLSLPKLNTSARGQYRKYFTESSRDAVAELWAEDIELFGYKFDD